MGYRSEVGYAIQGKKEQMVPVIMTLRLTDPLAKKALDECTFSTKGEQFTIKFYADSVKWYASYEEVDMHTRLFDAFREAFTESENNVDNSINGMFMRIGEEDQDIECDNFGHDPYDLMSLQRTFEFEVSAEDSLEEALK